MNNEKLTMCENVFPDPFPTVNSITRGSLIFIRRSYSTFRVLSIITDGRWKSYEASIGLAKADRHLFKRLPWIIDEEGRASSFYEVSRCHNRSGFVRHRAAAQVWGEKAKSARNALSAALSAPKRSPWMLPSRVTFQRVWRPKYSPGGAVMAHSCSTPPQCRSEIVALGRIKDPVAANLAHRRFGGRWAKTQASYLHFTFRNIINLQAFDRNERFRAPRTS